MNKLILIIITVAIAFGQIESIKYKDSYQSNGNDYKIKVTVKDAANSSGHGQKIYYRVYQNDEFMHPSNWGGGSFAGCRYPFTEFSDNYFISRIETDLKTIGWVITTGGICGNTKSLVSVLIIPSGSYRNVYSEYKILSKDSPTFFDNNGNIEVIYNYQEWGRGGTSTSIFVPSRFIINANGGNSISGKSVFDIIEIINKDRVKKGFYKVGFLELYMSGFNSRDAELMRYSIDNYLNDEKQLDYYKGFFGHWNEISKEKLLYNIKQIELAESIDIKF